MRISRSRIEAAFNSARTHVIVESLRRGWGVFALVVCLMALSLFQVFWPMHSQGFVVGVVESNGGAESYDGSDPNIEVRLAEGQRVIVRVPRGMAFAPNSRVELEAFEASVPYGRKDYRFRRRVGPSSLTEAPHALGPLQIGMARADIQALGLPVVSTAAEMEGDIYVRDAITLNDGVRIIATSSGGIIGELSTNTSGFATADGARVGDTLATLQRIYPNGDVAKGIGENGPYFIFMTGREVESFEFDVTGLSRQCLIENRSCPHDLPNRRSTSFNVR